jgi:hypothetical protein
MPFTGVVCVLSRYNTLQTLPDGPYLWRLQRLNIGKDHFPRIPLALSAATRLSQLDMSGNWALSLRPAGLEALQGLPCLRNLLLPGLPEGGARGMGLDDVREALPGVEVRAVVDGDYIG